MRDTAAAYRGELLVTALYMPIVMTILVPATSALGLTRAYVFGMIFILAVFAAAMALFLGVSVSEPYAPENMAYHGAYYAGEGTAAVQTLPTGKFFGIMQN